MFLQGDVTWGGMLCLLKRVTVVIGTLHLEGLLQVYIILKFKVIFLQACSLSPKSQKVK